jgi:hypothetical protein
MAESQNPVTYFPEGQESSDLISHLAGHSIVCRVEFPYARCGRCSESAAVPTSSNNPREFSSPTAEIQPHSHSFSLVESATSPDEFPTPFVAEAKVHRNLRFRLLSSFGFDFQWMRELTAGSLQGWSGVRVPQAGRLIADCSFHADVVIRIERQPDGWLRLQMRLASDSAAGLPLTAKVASTPDKAAKALLPALLGVEPLDWARSSILDVGSKSWKDLGNQLEVSTEDLAEFQEQWIGLGPALETALWQVAADSAALDNLASKLAEFLDKADTFVWEERFPRLLEGVAPASPVHVWLTAALQLAEPGTLLSKQGRLLQGARLSARILGRPALRSVLTALRAEADGMFEPTQLEAGLCSESSFPNLHPWIQRRLGQLMGTTGSATSAALLSLLPAAERIIRSIAQETGNALQTMFPQTVARSLSGGGDLPIIDCCFAPDPAGLAAMREALSGDLTVAFKSPGEAVKLLGGTLSLGARDIYIPVCLPFLDRKSAEPSPAAAAWSGDVTFHEGRILVHPSIPSAEKASLEFDAARALAAAFPEREQVAAPQTAPLVFSHHRAAHAGWRDPFWKQVLLSKGLLAAAENGEQSAAGVTVSLPGEAVGAWHLQPAAREAAFFPAFAKMSIALQRELRAWLPALYFDSPEKLDDPAEALPLLVYAASATFPGKPRAQFTYDVIDSRDMARFYRSASRHLGSLLQAVESSLRAAGRTEAANAYRVDPATVIKQMQRKSRRLASLLAAESLLVEEFIRFSERCREVNDSVRCPSGKVMTSVSKFTRDFVKSLQSRLKRMYGGVDFSGLHALLFLEATRALQSGTCEQGDVHATVSLGPAAAQHFFASPQGQPDTAKM